MLSIPSSYRVILAGCQVDVGTSPAQAISADFNADFNPEARAGATGARGRAGFAAGPRPWCGCSTRWRHRPGAAAAPLAGTYRRREPERTALYRVVLEHVETLLAQASLDGSGYPAFVEHELRRFLDSGQLSRGFARVRCPACGFERLVAFSCKGRICPSCWSRRAASIAAHLVDRVLPDAPWRQFVLTFPWPLRLRLAMNRALLSDMLGLFLGTLMAWQRRRGRALGMRSG